MRIFILLLGVLVFVVPFDSKAQLDPLYSQYQFNQLMINPAYAGAYKRISLGANTRVQWAGLEGAPVTNTITASSSIGNSVGVGAMLIDDRLGINRTTEFNVSGAYFINTGLNRFGFGIQGGLVNYGFDLSKLDEDVLGDPELALTNSDYTKPNFGTGIFYLAPSYYVGFSIPRILEVSLEDGVEESTRYKRHYYFSGGYVLNTKNFVDIKLSSLLRVVNGGTSVDLGATFILSDMIWAGISFRNLNSAILTGQVQINEQFRVGYTFELPTNDLINSSVGTHELMIAYDLAPLSGQTISARYF
ncbi:MAG: type IX secretion system membrane protein PorP/SprF [bacterium]|nr:type IX secretion system membrane protein PorP/SprF [bacterium]